MTTPDAVRIADLHARYSHALDAGDADRLASCFETDAELVVGDAVVVAGGRAIADRLVDRAPAGVLHLVGTITSVHRGGDDWSSESYFQLYSATDGSMTAIGRYDDVVRVDATNARYATRSVRYLWRNADA